MTKLKRTIESYAWCTPNLVAGGSPAQMEHFVADAKADIATLAEENAKLSSLLKAVTDRLGVWAVYANVDWSCDTWSDYDAAKEALLTAGNHVDAMMISRKGGAA